MKALKWSAANGKGFQNCVVTELFKLSAFLPTVAWDFYFRAFALFYCCSKIMAFPFFGLNRQHLWKLPIHKNIFIRFCDFVPPSRCAMVFSGVLVYVWFLIFAVLCQTDIHCLHRYICVRILFHFPFVMLFSLSKIPLSSLN